MLLLDKTGTITLGNRQAPSFHPDAGGVTEAELAEAAQLASLADETPEGRSIVVLAKQYGIREHELAAHERDLRSVHGDQTRMSGVDFDGTRLRKGAGDAIDGWIAEQAARAPAELRARRSTRIARDGGTPLAVAEDSRCSASIYLKDIVKDGMSERFDQLRRDGHPDDHGHRRQPR